MFSIKGRQTGSGWQLPAIRPKGVGNRADASFYRRHRPVPTWQLGQDLPVWVRKSLKEGLLILPCLPISTS